MKTNISSLWLIFGLLVAPSPIFAQAAPSLFPAADAGSSGLVTDSGRNMERQTAGSAEFQRTCPQPVGDAWDNNADQAWNVLELGVQVSPEQKPAPKLQLYTRYTCQRPLDRTSR